MDEHRWVLIGCYDGEWHYIADYPTRERAEACRQRILTHPDRDPFDYLVVPEANWILFQTYMQEKGLIDVEKIHRVG